jgi:GDPmannose 4,6-dehydratase
MIKRALITGIAGQDGSYLTEYLLSLGYEVHGIVRRHSVAENQNHRLHRLDLNDLVKTYYGDLLDYPSLMRIINEVDPHEIYNLGAMSHAKFYQASSSEMFGNSVDKDGVQRLTTPMNPVSPYGCAKVMGYNLVRHYRHAYGLHACNGILFNHESPRRGSNFVTNKVVKGAVSIKKGLQDKLELGNMDSYRDWGHSKDYVRAMHMIINHQEADEFIVATGETHSVRDLCQTVFEKLDMNYEDFVVQNPKYMRPEELKYLKGDLSKTRKILGWTPVYTFETMLDEMIERWEKEL